MSNVTWYIGDVLTTGNTIVTNNLYVFGTTLTPNLVAGSAVGMPSGPFAGLVTSNANATTLNISSFASPLAMNVVRAGGAALNVLGNVTASTALTSLNVSVTRINTSVLNVFSFSAPLALNTTSASGTSLFVSGNVSVSGTLLANVLTQLANLSFSNVTTTVAGDKTLNVVGNATVSNALSVSNVQASNVNTATLNVLTITAPLAFNCASASGTTMNLVGDLMVSNAVGSSNLVSGVLTTTLANVTGTAIVGASTFPVQGNATVSNALTTTNVLVQQTLNVATFSATKNLVVLTFGLVQGNIVVSNSLTVPNVSAALTNVGTLNVFSIPGPFGINASPDGFTTAFVSGNVWASNALSAPNVLTQGLTVLGRANVTTALSALTIGGTSANVFVQGNAVVSNALTVANVFGSTSLNVSSTLNVLSFSTPSPFQVLGNVSVSNTLTTTNVTSGGIMNASSVLNVSSISTLGLGGPLANLQVAGNMVASNALTTGAFLATGVLNPYVEDLTRRSIHLVPSSANSALIQSWIGARAQKAFPGAYQVSTVGAPVSGFFGSVVLPDSRVVFVPWTTSNVGIMNPRTGLCSTVPSRAGFRGGVLLPDGRVVFVPNTSSAIGIFSPVTLQTTLVPTGITTPGFSGGTLLPSGNVAFFPYSYGGQVGQFQPGTGAFSLLGPGFSPVGGGVIHPSGRVILAPGSNPYVFALDPNALTSTAYGPVPGFAGTDSYSGAVLDPLGNVVFVPALSGNVVSFSLATGTSTLIQACADGAWAFSGGTLTPTGNLVFAPNTSANVGFFDPVALAFSNGAPSSGGGGFTGASLVPSGSITFTPGPNASGPSVLSGGPPSSGPEFCLAPFLNKF